MACSYMFAESRPQDALFRLKMASMRAYVPLLKPQEEKPNCSQHKAVLRAFKEQDAEEEDDEHLEDTEGIL